jgi:hypothetical protein
VSEGKAEGGYEGWAILELMGHRRIGGRISEATVAGAPFVRIDVPHPQDLQAMVATQFYSPAAVYAITPATEAMARAVALGAPEPVSRWELRSRDDAAFRAIAAGLDADEPF